MCYQIAAMTTKYAAECEGGSETARSVVECIVGATLPLVASMFSGGTPQERMLFALALTGACVNVTDHRDAYKVEVSVSPEAIREALGVFHRITGGDIRQHLPKQMLEYASQQHSLH
jgi:hypothetical protein